MTAKRLKKKHVNGVANGTDQALRFYPESMPVFAHEPMRDSFAIRPISDDCGEGVVALRPFRKGEVVFAFSGFYMSEITLFTLQVKPGLYLHDPFFMGKILHRCDPNCDVDMNRRTFTARRDIAPGEWVTMNYEQTEDRLFRPFICNCGARPCDGLEPSRVIRGRKVRDATSRRGSRKVVERIARLGAQDLSR